MALHQQDRAENIRRLDGVVKSAHKQGVGLVSSLFWHFSCVPDLVHKPIQEWANPQSKSNGRPRKNFSVNWLSI